MAHLDGWHPGSQTTAAMPNADICIVVYDVSSFYFAWLQICRIMCTAAAAYIFQFTFTLAEKNGLHLHNCFSYKVIL